MILVRFVTIGGVELYKTESDDLDVIIENLNDAMIRLNIVRHTPIKDTFDDLNENFLTQEVFLENAKLNGIHMAGGTIDNQHIELIYRIV